MEIEEIKRDDSLDYLKILKALMEIPFPVGRNLLVDFLNGKYTNKSITKNKLDELTLFGTLKWGKEEILSLIDRFVQKKMIEQTSFNGNSFVKVLKITLRGRNEVSRPTMNKPPEPVMELEKTEISDWDQKVFSKYEEFLDELNDEQKKAVVSPAKNLLTIAGAGSGKTLVLVKRIEFLVKHRKANPEEILAITFTRKARMEMEKRLNNLGIRGVRVCTFNSFSEGILRKYGKDLYGRHVRVLGYPDKVLALNIVLMDLDLNIEDVVDMYFSKSMKRMKTPNQLHNIFLNDCFNVIDYFRVRGIDLYDFSVDADSSEKEMASLVYKIVKALVEHKKVQGLRSFTDQLVDVVGFFRARPVIIPYYEHVLVDEYQDVNSVQVNILNLLNYDNLFAVGDPRQSIYGWRGSDMKFLLKFEEDFGDTETVYLTRNYRSLRGVVDFMNLAIRHMNLPDLEHHQDGISNLKLFSFENEEAERQFVLQVVEDLIKSGKEVFILGRTNRQILDFSEVLKRKGIRFMLKTDEYEGNGKEEEDGEFNLTLATVHAIKGLEADNVFIIGANKDSFPCRASDHPVIELIKSDGYDKLEEEKRLFYVAISRAKRNLYLTYTGSQTEFITKDMEAMM